MAWPMGVRLARLDDFARVDADLRDAGFFDADFLEADFLDADFFELVLPREPLVPDAVADRPRELALFLDDALRLRVRVAFMACLFGMVTCDGALAPSARAGLRKLHAACAARARVACLACDKRDPLRASSREARENPRKNYRPE
jgi:hypothetical protein